MTLEQLKRQRAGVKGLGGSERLDLAGANGSDSEAGNGRYIVQLASARPQRSFQFVVETTTHVHVAL